MPRSGRRPSRTGWTSSRKDLGEKIGSIRKLNLVGAVRRSRSLPLLVTETVLPGLVMAVFMNQGIPRQTRMSNTLLPRALLTAISPWPSGNEKDNQFGNVRGFSFKDECATRAKVRKSGDPSSSEHFFLAKERLWQERGYYVNMIEIKCQRGCLLAINKSLSSCQDLDWHWVTSPEPDRGLIFEKEGRYKTHKHKLHRAFLKREENGVTFAHRCSKCYSQRIARKFVTHLYRFFFKVVPSFEAKEAHQGSIQPARNLPHQGLQIS